MVGLSARVLDKAQKLQLRNGARKSCLHGLRRDVGLRLGRGQLSGRLWRRASAAFVLQQMLFATENGRKRLAGKGVG